MEFFYHLIFLACVVVRNSYANDDNNYILCTSHCPQFSVSFSQSLTFPAECQSNDNQFNIHVKALVCSIEYRINYDYQQIEIHLHATNDTTQFVSGKPGESLYQEMHLHLSEYSYPLDETIRRYSCNTKNDCAKDFYMNTIHNYVEDGKSQLDTIKRKLHNESLIIGRKSRRQCHVSEHDGNATTKLCKDGLCYVHYEIHKSNEEQSTKTLKCDLERVHEPSLHSITQYTPSSAEKERSLLEYKCNKNVCTRSDLVLKIQSLIDKYTGWNPLVQEKSLHGGKGNTSTKQTVCSYILVLFLIFTQSFF